MCYPHQSWNVFFMSISELLSASTVSNWYKMKEILYIKVLSLVIIPLKVIHFFYSSWKLPLSRLQWSNKQSFTYQLMSTEIILSKYWVLVRHETFPCDKSISSAMSPLLSAPSSLGYFPIYNLIEVIYRSALLKLTET